MTFYISTFGCKVNQYESEYVRELLLENGYIEANDFSSADINIINTCTVTQTADSKNRKLVNRIKRENENSIVILLGCMPQTVDVSDDNIYQNADIVLGNNNLSSIVFEIQNYLKSKSKIYNVRQHINGEEFENINVNNFNERTRAFVKIEDGCNQFCTYCTIPYARGRVRSKDLETLKGEIESLANNGYKEIVLVGINLSCFGLECGLDITDAVKCVCSVDKIKRVRLGSFEPERLTNEMLEKLSKEEKFCPQFHLSLQSGSTDTLKRMHRHYSSEEYYDIVCNIRKHFDNPSITTDIMVGFAGETDKEFQESLDFAKKVNFSRVHIFPYSRRKGTKAYDYDNHVPDNIKNIRFDLMEKETEISKNEFLDTQIGKIEPVLFEIKDSDGFYRGYTKNYTLVRVNTNEDVSGQIRDTKIISHNNESCIGELC